MDGAIPDDDADEIIKIMNGRLTSREYDKAPLTVQREDDDKGDYELDDDDYQKLNEDMWYLLKDKLDGDDALGKLKGLEDGEGIMGYQKLYKFYSVVTGSTSSHKMGLAMNPDRPKRVNEVANRLEKWSQLVNALEKYGPSYSLGLPHRVTLLKSIMCHASE